MKGEKLYKLLPNSFQNFLVFLYNKIEYKKRYGGNYNQYLEKFKQNRSLSISQLKEIQNERFLDLLNYAIKNSSFYRSLYANTEMPSSVEEIAKLPIVDKELLRKNISDVYTIDSKSAIIGKTGGTTGKSLEVLFTHDNMQERFAMLDDFRGRFGYKLGKKTAWFSGKSLLTERDIRKKRFWKTDYLHNVRYYSTFHIKDEYLKYYVEDIIQFQPEYLVGFPSTIMEIAKYGTRHGYTYREGVTKAIFPTAETITSEMRKVIEPFFHSKMYNQYASSEGAPFIFECSEGNLHMELQSGVFEVLDDNDRPATSGRLVVTSFTTYGTPLIRYDIGDSITLEDEKLIALAKKFVKATNWRGGCELEVMLTDKEEPYIMEVNPRFPAWIYLTAAAGQNQPASLVKMAMGEKVKPFTDYEVGKVFIRYSWDLITDINEFQTISGHGEL